MPKNIFGPGHSPNANETTTRPTPAATGKPSDTWFLPCSAPGANDGTTIESMLLNFIIANLRHAVRGMNVVENEIDDDMLLKAIQAASGSSSFLALLDTPENFEGAAGKSPVVNSEENGLVFPDLATEGAAWQNLLIYPEVFTSGNIFSISATTGQVTVDAGQSWLHRGWQNYSSADIEFADRNFTTVANKTYHLRWNPTDGFLLKDLADGAYNPSALAETSSAFDTDYDDMLAARIVTDGSNVATITPLKNKATLSFNGHFSGVAPTDAGANAWASHYGTDLNWARTPKTPAYSGYLYATGGAGYVQGGVQIGGGTDRYAWTARIATDWSAPTSGYLSECFYSAMA
jgi:hypothetical protein